MHHLLSGVWTCFCLLQDEDEIDASIREVNQLLNNANIGEDNYGSAAGDVNFNASTSYKALLTVEHK